MENASGIETAEGYNLYTTLTCEWVCETVYVYHRLLVGSSVLARI